MMFKEEKGVISIAMAILIPVIIFGVIYVYALLSTPQRENTVHKIVYASSEAYLSRYNTYLYDQMCLLTNLDSEGLEPLIIHYLQRNDRIDSPESASINIDYEKLSDPIVFKEAVVEASTLLIGNAVVNYSVDLLDQFSFADKIRTLNQSIQVYEKKLSEQFDKTGAIQFLKNIETSHDLQTDKTVLQALEDYLNEQYETYFKTYEAMETEIARSLTAVENPKQTLKTYLEEKEVQWCDSEKAFVSDYEDYMIALSLIKEHLAQIELEEATERMLISQIEAEIQKKPLDQATIDSLEAMHLETKERINCGFSEIDDIVSELIVVSETSDVSLIRLLKDLILEAEYLFSGVEIGSAELVLDACFIHSEKNRNDQYGDPMALAQKVKMNEYFLSIFSSYDINCPRVIDPQNRHEALRVIKGESEYLISGLMKEKQSISLVRLKIFAIRSAANLVTLLSDKDKLSKLSTATVAMPQPWRTLTYSVAIAVWSGVESYSDINRLMKGEGFYFLKTKAQWQLDFDTLLDGSWKKQFSNNIGQSSNAEQPSMDERSSIDEQSSLGESYADPNLYYMDYLRLLLLIQDEQTTLLRAMDLVEAELLSASEGKTSLKNFSRGHTIDLKWKPQVVFGFMPNDVSTLHMRNGFK